MIDSIVDLINHHYCKVFSIDVDNTSFGTVEKVEEIVVTKQSKVFEVEKNLGKEETAMLEVIGFALDKLDSSKPIKEQLDSFLSDIDMPANEVIVQSFIIACNIDKITYGCILCELDKSFSYLRRKRFNRVLKETFKIWLEKYPTLQEKFPRVSFMTMLKLFSKRFK